MSKPRIIFLVGGALTQRWLFNYRIDELSEAFSVEYWDCSPLIAHPYNVQKAEERDYVYLLDSYETLDQRLSVQPQDAILIPEIGFCEENYPLLKRISSKIRYCILIDIWSYNLLQYIDSLSTSATNDKQSNHSFAPKKLVRKLLRRIKSLFKPQTKPNQPVVIDYDQACKDLFEMFEISYQPTAKYSINHVDYEKYLEVKAQPTERKDKYIVYVGQYYPLHPEYAIIEPNVDFPSLVPSFYASLNRFFDKLEETYHCPVVIAEHPSGNNKDNPYNGHEVVFYKTAELIRDSSAVCMHCTNAFTMVALFNKPLSIITCDALRVSKNVGGRTAKFASVLNIPLIDAGTVEDVSNVFYPIDNQIRNSFLSVFVDAGRQEKNAELLTRHIHSIYNEITENNITK